MKKLSSASSRLVPISRECPNEFLQIGFGFCSLFPVPCSLTLMNCVRCQYLLWDLPEPRCPECGLDFDVTDYAFPKESVAFLCKHCGESYLGTSDQGLPTPTRFSCTQCHAELDAASMPARPLKDDAQGESVRLGTAWERRRRIGYVRSYLDGVARLALQPADYFRLSSAASDHGEMIFSVSCAYLAAAVLVGIVILLQQSGLLAWMPKFSWILHPRPIILLTVAIPMAQIIWNHAYGLFIQAVLAILGQQGSDYGSSVRAVAFGSAVLPAVLLLPPIGLLWYVNVVSSGVQHLHSTSKGQALIATMIPMLAAGNILLIVGYALFA